MYTCPITQLVTREPVQTKCCKKFFEAIPIQICVETNSTYPSCRKNINITNIVNDDVEDDALIERNDTINWFRMEIRKTFQTITSIS